MLEDHSQLSTLTAMSMDDQDFTAGNDKLGFELGAFQPTAPSTPEKPYDTICDGRIRLLEILGQGAYGEVYKGQEKTGGLVAVKKMKTFTGRSWQGISQTTLREISLLKSMNHKNVVKLREIVFEDGKAQQSQLNNDPANQQMSTMYLIFEMGKTDLHKVLQKSYMFTGRGLEPKRIKNILFQLLEGITFLHANRTLHRDLKPENLLLTEEDRLLICDLGLARTVHMPLRPYSQEILTLWYKAPEMCISNREYSVGVDSWSIGCIFVEMLTAKPLFPASSSSELLTMMVKVLGNPFHPDSKVVKHNLPFNPQLASVLKLMPKQYYPGHTSSPINQLAAYFSPEDREHGFSLLCRLLDMNPLSRITPIQALQHPYFLPEITTNTQRSR